MGLFKFVAFCFIDGRVPCKNVPCLKLEENKEDIEKTWKKPNAQDEVNLYFYLYGLPRFMANCKIRTRM